MNSTLVKAVLVSLLVRELWGWIPTLSRSVIRVVTLLLPRDRQARREEWLAELYVSFDEHRIAGLIWTIKLGGICLYQLLAESSRLLRRDPATLLSRSDTWFFRQLAAMVLIISSVSGFSTSMAAEQIFRSLTVSIVVGVGIWATLIWCDWWLLMRGLRRKPPPGSGGSGGSMIGRVASLARDAPRLLLSIALGALVSESVMLLMFAPEIDARVAVTGRDGVQARLQALGEIERRFPNFLAIHSVIALLFTMWFVLPLAATLLRRGNLVIWLLANR